MHAYDQSENASYRKLLINSSCKVMIPADGGARPDAMLLESMPTGFFSMKLLYMVHAVNGEKQRITNEQINLKYQEDINLHFHHNKLLQYALFISLPPSGSTP